jgi:hypothetical protein
VPFERIVGGHRYLGEGSPATAASPRFIAEDFEDPWNRGRHDAALVIATVAALLPSTQTDTPRR